MENAKAKRNIDFTRGSISRNLILFAIPLFIGAVFQLLYNLVDSSVLGRYVSMQALAAVGATGTTMMLMTQLTNALTNAMSIRVSHAWGAHDPALMRRLLAHCVELAALLGLLLMVMMRVCSGPLMCLLRTPDDILAGATLYLQITCGFYIGQLFYNMATAVLRAIGDSRTPLLFLIFSSLLNVALDLLFVLAFRMEIAGVAWATVISQTVSAILCLVYMFRRYPALRFSRADMKPDKEILKKYAAIALPMAFQGVMLSIGDMTVTSVINSFGTDTVAAYTIGQKCIQIVQITFSQIAFSMSVYTGQNFGAGLYDRVREGLRRALCLLGAMVAASMLILFLFGGQLMKLYLDPAIAGEAVPALVLQYIRVTTCFLPALCFIWTYNSSLRGVGCIPPTVVSSFLELGCKIGLSLLLSKLFGTLGLWFALPLGWVIGLIPSVWAFHTNRWVPKKSGD